MLVFLSSALLWCFVTPLFFRIVNLVCGVALGVFAAIRLLWEMLLLLGRAA